MSDDGQAKALAFKAEIERKIDKLLADFQEGKISRQQFHLIYGRYNNHLGIANETVNGLNDNGLDVVSSGMSTLAIRQASQGRAIGLTIYHHRNGTLVETLGNFDVPPDVLSPVLNDINDQRDDGKPIRRRVMQLEAHDWLLLATGRLTTVITQFKHEPSRLQMDEIERLHLDFETANRLFLRLEKVDGSKLAYPFLTFVQKKLQT